LENRKAIVSLLTAYLNKQVSREEFDRLFSVLAELEDEDFRKTVLQALDNESDATDVDLIQERVSHLYPQIQAKIQVKLSQKKGQIWWRVSAAAALVLAFLSIGLYVIQTQPYQGESTIALTPERILPGGNRATLTLADGRSIDLSTRKSGIVVKNGIKYTDGSSVINQQTNDSSIKEARLGTPKGGQYQVTLSDGTQVWLNAASTLTYPIEFDDHSRQVTLDGEAYFAVAKDKARPFIVNTAKQRVEVLGTSFNINAYSNETATKTTLLTGSVRVNIATDASENGHGRILVPNQQSIVRDHAHEITIHDVDPQSAIAWKNGLFNFHGLSVDESLKQVERWYDIRIVYQGNKPEGYLGGKMSRGVKLATFLNFLEKDFQIKSEMRADRTLVLTTSERTQ